MSTPDNSQDEYADMLRDIMASFMATKMPAAAPEPTQRDLAEQETRENAEPDTHGDGSRQYTQ